MTNILIEANCIFDYDDKNTTLPKCCLRGQNKIGINCLKYNGDIHQYCPFLIFGTAKATLALTDGEGDVINSNVFWGDLKMSAEEWKQKENEWIIKQNSYLSEQNTDALHHD